MKMAPGPLVIVVAGMLFPGCAGPEDTGGDAAERAVDGESWAGRPAIAALETRIAQLELSQARLQTSLTEAEAELVKLRAVAAKTPTGGSNSNAAPVKSGVPSDAQLERIIEAKIEEKIGTHAEIETIFSQAVAEGMEDYERRKEEEARQRAEERRQEHERRREEREERRLSEIAETLELSGMETDELREARAGAREAISELFRVVREERGAYSREEIRSAMEEIRSGHEAVVAEFMSEDQVKAYSEMESSRMPFGMMGGRRGRGPR